MLMPEAMRYCKRCTHPNTRPRIVFDADGICNGCQRTNEKVAVVDWNAREEELKARIQAAMDRMPDRRYDVLVPVSGGKDSTFQAWYTSKKLGLNTLCVNVQRFLPTEVGVHNLRNLVERLPVDLLSITANQTVQSKLTRYFFEDTGDPQVPHLYLIFSHIAQIAIEKRVPIILFGENGDREYAGSNAPEFTLLDERGVHARIRSNKLHYLYPNEWPHLGFTKEEVAIYQEPGDTAMQEAGVERIFLSDYLPWNNNYHLHVALNVVGGFRMREERSIGTYTFGYSTDCDLYDLYIWMTYPKFGFCRTIKYSSKDIQEGKLTREKAIKMVRDYDGEFPWHAADRFIAKTGMSEDQFWGVVASFVNDDKNVQRQLAKGVVQTNIPAWERLADRKWRMRQTLDGNETLLELPLRRTLNNVSPPTVDTYFP